VRVAGRDEYFNEKIEIQFDDTGELKTIHIKEFKIKYRVEGN
jgi:capsule polysaccharide export protein KpsE/RkpR